MLVSVLQLWPVNLIITYQLSNRLHLSWLSWSACHSHCTSAAE